MKQKMIGLGLFFGVTGCLMAAEPKPLFEADFQSAAADKVPEDFLVLDGAFAVMRTVATNSSNCPARRWIRSASCSGRRRIAD